MSVWSVVDGKVLQYIEGEGWVRARLARAQRAKLYAVTAIMLPVLYAARIAHLLTGGRWPRPALAVAPCTCGAAPEVIIWEAADGVRWLVACNLCSLEGGSAPTRDEAVALWAVALRNERQRGGWE